MGQSSSRPQREQRRRAEEKEKEKEEREQQLGTSSPAKGVDTQPATTTAKASRRLSLRRSVLSLVKGSSSSTSSPKEKAPASGERNNHKRMSWRRSRRFSKSQQLPRESVLEEMPEPAPLRSDTHAPSAAASTHSSTSTVKAPARATASNSSSNKGKEPRPVHDDIPQDVVDFDVEAHQPSSSHSDDRHGQQAVTSWFEEQLLAESQPQSSSSSSGGSPSYSLSNSHSTSQSELSTASSSLSAVKDHDCDLPAQHSNRDVGASPLASMPPNPAINSSSDFDSDSRSIRAVAEAPAVSPSEPPSSTPVPQTQANAPPPPPTTTQRTFPPPGTLVVVQGIVHTTDVTRPAPSPPPAYHHHHHRHRAASRPVSTSVANDRFGYRGRYGEDQVVDDDDDEYPAPLDEWDSMPRRASHSQRRSGERQLAPTEPHGHVVPGISPGSIDVLGTLLSVAAAATAASLLTGSADPLTFAGASANGLTAPSPGPGTTTAPTTTVPNSTSSSTGDIGGPDAVPAGPHVDMATRADRMRHAWGTIRERLGLRAPPLANGGASTPMPLAPALPLPDATSTETNAVDSAPLSDGEPLQQPLPAVTDTRELMLAEMARAFNIGLGLNGMHGLTQGANGGAGVDVDVNPAADVSASPGPSPALAPIGAERPDPTSHPVSPTGSASMPSTSTPSPTAFGFGIGAPPLDGVLPPEGSFDRFLVDLQTDLREALSVPSLEDGGRPSSSHEEEEDGPASESVSGSEDGYDRDDEDEEEEETEGDFVAASTSTSTSTPATASHQQQQKRGSESGGYDSEQDGSDDSRGESESGSSDDDDDDDTVMGHERVGPVRDPSPSRDSDVVVAAIPTTAMPTPTSSPETGDVSPEVQAQRERMEMQRAERVERMREREREERMRERGGEEHEHDADAVPPRVIAEGEDGGDARESHNNDNEEQGLDDMPPLVDVSDSSDDESDEDEDDELDGMPPLQDVSDSEDSDDAWDDNEDEEREDAAVVQERMRMMFNAVAPPIVRDTATDPASNITAAGVSGDDERAAAAATTTETTPPRDANSMGRGRIDAHGRINWWRMYRFPPITAPRAGAGHAGANASPSSASDPTATATAPAVPPAPTGDSPPTANGDSSPSTLAAPFIPNFLPPPPGQTVVPVIVVGLQSVNATWDGDVMSVGGLDVEHEAVDGGGAGGPGGSGAHVVGQVPVHSEESYNERRPFADAWSPDSLEEDGFGGYTPTGYVGRYSDDEYEEGEGDDIYTDMDFFDLEDAPRLGRARREQARRDRERRRAMRPGAGRVFSTVARGGDGAVERGGRTRRNRGGSSGGASLGGGGAAVPPAQALGTPPPPATTTTRTSIHTGSNVGSRTFLIYVIGGYYPPEHAIVSGGLENFESFEALLEIAEMIGHSKPPTATKEAIEKSGLEIIRPHQLAQYEDAGRVAYNCVERCLICLDDYEEEDDIRLMTCRHAFHKTCVDTWLQTGRNNCPACRGTGVETNISAPAPVLGNTPA